MGTNAYQSPIALDKFDAIEFSQNICIEGENKGAIFNEIKKIYEVQDKIYLTLNGRKFQLDEYHFHTPSEHKVNYKIHDAEIHYVFVEVARNREEKRNTHCLDICSCSDHHEDNVLVIGRLINDTSKIKDLTKLQVKVPSEYYEYDGTLKSGVFSPVRWIVGENHIHYNIEEIAEVAKTARSIQDLDGRIVLYYVESN